MLDIKFIRDNPEIVKKAIIDKRINLNLDDLLDLDTRRRSLLAETETLQATKNSVSKEILKLNDEQKRVKILEPQDMLPAPCQGCLGLEVREDNKDILSLLEEIRHPASDTTARAERAFLQGLGRDCSIPLGAYSRIDKDKIFMEAVLFDESAQTRVTAVEEGPSNLPELVGAQLAGRLLFNGGSSILLTGSLPQK
jgi:hydroxymethylbilane synthase